MKEEQALLEANPRGSVILAATTNLKPKHHGPTKSLVLNASIQRLQDLHDGSSSPKTAQTALTITTSPDDKPVRGHKRANTMIVKDLESGTLERVSETQQELQQLKKLNTLKLQENIFIKNDRARQL